MDVKAGAHAQVARGDHLHQLGPARLKSLGAGEEKQGQGWLPISPTYDWWYAGADTANQMGCSETITPALGEKGVQLNPLQASAGNSQSSVLRLQSMTVLQPCFFHLKL